jgi:hypothetical protein
MNIIITRQAFMEFNYIQAETLIQIISLIELFVSHLRN